MCIRDSRPDSKEAQHRRDVDDLATALAQPMASRELAHAEGGGQVYVYDALPIIHWEFLTAVATRNSGAVDKYVDAAQCSQRVAKSRVQLLHISNVSLHWMCAQCLRCLLYTSRCV